MKETLKDIGVLVAAFSVWTFIFWMGGWNFERKDDGAMWAILSFVTSIGAMVIRRVLK